ncbi:MAG: hypothetical protein FJY97_13470 [candidate division Zixibacteria bacterium]|nr:hypothetical protein [candidate division Zixibacteria bacterium]
MTHDEEGLASVERGEWRSVPNTAQKRQRYQQYATATFEKDRRINIRLSRKDLEALQTLALEEGLPYQTIRIGTIKKGGISSHSSSDRSLGSLSLGIYVTLWDHTENDKRVLTQKLFRYR